MTWNIEPLVGLGGLRLGMNEQEVANFFPKDLPVRKQTVFDNSVNEYRGLGQPVCNYVNNSLRGIDTDHRVRNIFFEKMDVYAVKPKEFILKLQEKNGGAKYGVGILLFDKISITTSGFYIKSRGFYLDGYDDGQDERTLGVYANHAFDPLMSEFKNVKLR